MIGELTNLILVIGELKGVPPPPSNMGYNGYGINLCGVAMILMGTLHAWGHSDRGILCPSTPVIR